MPQHETKNCPLCQSQFECKLGTINLCQCTKVQLNDAERAYIREQFEDCLCASCMALMKKEYTQKVFEDKVNRAYNLFNLKSPFKNE